METKKLSRTVQKRLNRKKRLQLQNLNKSDAVCSIEAVPCHVSSKEQTEEVLTAEPQRKETKKRSKKGKRHKKKSDSVAANENKPEEQSDIAATIQSEIETTSTAKKKGKRKYEDQDTDALYKGSAEKKSKIATVGEKHPHKSMANKVIFINKNYGGSDPNSVGRRIQAELIELRNQAESIQTASDLTESQAHVIKRQITRLQGTGKEKHKHGDKRLDQKKQKKKYTKNVSNLHEATLAIKLMVEKQLLASKNKK